MKRKDFLKKLGIGVGVVAVAPTVIAEVSKDKKFDWYKDKLPDSIHGEYEPKYLHQQFKIYTFPALRRGRIFYQLDGEKEVLCSVYKKFADGLESLTQKERNFIWAFGENGYEKFARHGIYEDLL